MLRIYLSLVRTVCKYACQVWATCLTEELCTVLESIQRRALIIIVPHLTYEKGCNYLDLPLLKDRCKELCSSFFNQMTIDDHQLNDVIPEKRLIMYNVREQSEHPLPLCKTNIYKNTLISGLGGLNKVDGPNRLTLSVWSIFGKYINIFTRCTKLESAWYPNDICCRCQ